MKTIEKTLRAIGCFVVGMGIGFAATSAYVIASTPAPEVARIVPPADQARYEPSSGRAPSGAGVAEEAGPPGQVHFFGRGAQRV